MTSVDAHVELLEDNIAEQIAESLKDAQNRSLSEDQRLEALEKAEHLLLTKDENGYLLDNFLDEILEFGSSSEYRIKCFVAMFIQNACKRDYDIMRKAIGSLSSLMSSDRPGEVFVLKKVITACAVMYPYLVKWAVAKRQDPDAQQLWLSFEIIKRRIMNNLDSSNEGVRTVVLKFLESVILCHSLKTDDSESGRGDLMCLNEVPRSHRFISYHKMVAEAKHCMNALIEQTTLSHITAQNLIATVNILCLIVRQRPAYMEQLIEAAEALHVNLPPTLSASQVKSVRKELKYHFLRILKHPGSTEIRPRVVTLLTDLGTSQAELNRAYPKDNKLKKRTLDDATNGDPSTSKRSRADEEMDKLDVDEYGEGSTPSSSDSRKQSAIDITAEYIFQRLSPAVACNLVVMSLVTLPDEMPPMFASSYTPIAAAGSEPQRRHLARMMATQATQAELGPGYEEMKRLKRKEFHERAQARSAGVIIPPTPAIDPSQRFERDQQEAKKPVKELMPPPKIIPKQKPKFSLIEGCVDMKEEEAIELFNYLFSRIMLSEKKVIQGGAGVMHNVILVRIASRFHMDEAKTCEDELRKFIVEDPKQHTELALLWLTELYAQYMGYSICMTSKTARKPLSKQERLAHYDSVMCGLLTDLYERGEYKEVSFHKIILETPLATPNALQKLYAACLDKVYGSFGLNTLRELILTRNRQRYELIRMLFDLVFHYEPESNLRHSVVETFKELCELEHMRNDVRDLLTEQLQFCEQPEPPKHFVPDADPDLPLEWDRRGNVIRSALTVFLAILPQDSTLILPLAETYAKSSKDFKKILLRLIDIPVRAIGAADPIWLDLAENCPEGTETLLARIVYILTERNPITKDLVVRLKRLHFERHTDVRAMIPVLNGLDKMDLLKILPQFVLKIDNRKTINSVYKKILVGKNIDTNEPVMDGVELMYEYHLIKPSNEEEQRNLEDNLIELINMLSKETVANAVERVMTLSEIPILFYTTLTAIYKSCPSLDGFLTNVVQKLISRGDWKEGEETKPAFFRTIGKLKNAAYAPVLMYFDIDEFTEYVEFNKQRDKDVVESLKEFLPSLSKYQLKAMNQDILDMLKPKEKEKKDREERDRDHDRDREKERKSRRREEERRASIEND